MKNIITELEQILKRSKITQIAFGKLTLLEGINREVNDTRVEKIRKSVLGLAEFLAVFIVAKNPFGKGYIVLDAQHRKSVFEGINPNTMVNCIVSKAETLEEIVNVMKLLNSTAGKWVLENYINAFAGMGKAEYVTLKEALKTNVLTTATLPMLLANDTRANVKASIESGSFIIANKNWKKNLEQIKECKKVGVIPESGNGKRIFMEGLVKLVTSPQYNHKKFVENLKKQNKDKFILATNKLEANGVFDYFLKIQNQPQKMRLAA